MNRDVRRPEFVRGSRSEKGSRKSSNVSSFEFGGRKSGPLFARSPWLALCGLGGSVCTLRPFLSHNNRELILFPRARWPIHHTCLSLRHLITQVRAYPHTVRASVRLPILAPTDYTTASSASASSASTSDERPPRAAIRENSERVSASASASLHVSPPSAARQAS